MSTPNDPQNPSGGEPHDPSGAQPPAQPPYGAPPPPPPGAQPPYGSPPAQPSGAPSYPAQPPYPEQPSYPAQPQYGAPPQQPYGSQQPGVPQAPQYGAGQYPATQYPAGPYPSAPQYAGEYGYGASPTARNSLGVWSLVLGIVSLVACGVITGIAAIIVGSNARKAVARGEANNPGMATAGIVLGWIGVALTVVGLVVVGIIRSAHMS